MKFVRFTSAEYPDGAYGLFNDKGEINVLRGGLLDPIEKTGKTIREQDIVRYLPPVDPPNMLAIGLNYFDHAVETESKMPEEPLLFIKATTCVVGNGDNIMLPKIAPNMVDYEAELAVIIGRSARNVSEEEALDYVFGYTCGHDVSARDFQDKDGQWARAKSQDTFGPIGPYVVTDLDPTNLNIQFRLNGKVMQDSNTKYMARGVAKLISHLSKSMTLRPGTVLMTGTPNGVGVSRKPQVFLKPGDVCEVEIEGIGILKNTVIAEQ